MPAAKRRRGPYSPRARGAAPSPRVPHPPVAAGDDRVATEAAQPAVGLAYLAQLARLAAYKAAHGDCNVPRGWAEDPRLARWVTKQRVLKRQLDRGEPSQGMTAGRAARLTALGFAWAPRVGSGPDLVGWEAA